MKFEFGPGHKKLIIAVIVALVLITIVVILFRRRAKYQYPEPAPASTEGNTLTAAIAQCTTNYRSAIQAGQTDSTPPKAVCIQNAVNTYFRDKCPFIAANQSPQAYESSTGTSVSDTAKDAYTQYTGGTKIGGDTVSGGGDSGAVTASTQYTSLSFGALSYGLTSDIVTRARKADLTGPTRKYIGTACPNFYTPSDSSITDYSSTYTGWQAVSTAPSTGYGFYAPLVSPASNVYAWAIKAGTPITVTAAVAADPTATTTTSKTVSVDGLPAAISAGTKIKFSGIGGIFAAAAAASAGATSISVTYDGTGSGASATGFPAIAVGANILKSTAVTISTIGPAGSTSPLPYTYSGGVTNSIIVNVAASALDDSMVNGAQVLISGAQGITGPVKITAVGAASGGTMPVTLSLNSLTSFAIPLGATLENIMDIPYAKPLVASQAMYVTTASTSSTGTSINLTVNGNRSPSALPTTAATGIAVTLSSVTLPAGTNIKAHIASGTTLTLTNYNAAGTATSISWPAIPAGTIIFDNTNAPIVTGTNTLYNKLGTLAGQKMFNWQIAQNVGPGTFWITSGANQIGWQYA